jgi:cytidylate kinase
MLIAIDGPAGAGKSTVARAVAAALGYTYLDSGAMYRSVALARLRNPGQDPSLLSIDVGSRILLDGEDVTDAIRSAEVAEAASRVSAEPEVRRAMVALQRGLLSRGDWVAEGRDIGTVVAPEAELKVYLTASPEERARRRARDLGADERAVLRDLRERDERDMTRADSPLRMADGAVELDTTGLDVDEVVARVVALALERQPA